MSTAVVAQLAVRDGRAALAFYAAAFGAVVEYQVGGTDEDEPVVAQLAVGGSPFWVADQAPSHGTRSPQAVGAVTAKMLLVVDDPDAVQARAVSAGAAAVVPVEEGHGWRLGCVVDPFGHRWEIGRPLGPWPPP